LLIRNPTAHGLDHPQRRHHLVELAPQVDKCTSTTWVSAHPVWSPHVVEQFRPRGDLGGMADEVLEQRELDPRGTPIADIVPHREMVWVAKAQLIDTLGLLRATLQSHMRVQEFIDVDHSSHHASFTPGPAPLGGPRRSLTGGSCRVGSNITQKVGK
jgi:hypothetical protein